MVNLNRGVVMNNPVDFLTSDLAIIIYIVCLILCGGVFSYYYIKKGSIKRKQKQNTRELENFVLEVEKSNSDSSSLNNKEEEPVVLTSSPVTITTSSALENVDIIEELAADSKVIEEPKVEEIIEQQKIEPSSNIEEKNEQENITNNPTNEDELTYAPIELDEQEAKKELEKITQKLVEKEEQKKAELIAVADEKEDSKNISLTNFEKEQEENAIISLDELMAKASDIYEKNEEIQYQDEGDEPISIADLQAKWEEEQRKIAELEKEVTVEEIVEPESVQIKVEEQPLKQVTIDQFEVASKEKEPATKFKSSPIISPIYGIERKEHEELERTSPPVINSQELALENTANYEKFDEEIRKTNEFIATLKELQKKLD